MQLSHLKSLLLQHNELSDLPDGFGQLVSLEELVNYNFLKNIYLLRNVNLSMFCYCKCKSQKKSLTLQNLMNIPVIYVAYQLLRFCVFAQNQALLWVCQIF